MKTQRTTKELLELLLNKEFQRKYFNSGLCNFVYALYANNIIGRDERKVLIDYIHKHFPINKNTIHSFFAGDFEERSYFYWRPGNIEPRERWIKKHIRKLSK